MVAKARAMANLRFNGLDACIISRKGLPLHLPSEYKVERGLTVLTQQDVAASTQSQAFDGVLMAFVVSN